ncbi:MAG: hypothetical protein LVQ97_00465 [Candidatus Micrarchaeales archaeon]|jgi:hypothetical protein|nr:hypothetical protein [Candidatus Micrarchaeales archaeon]
MDSYWIRCIEIPAVMAAAGLAALLYYSADLPYWIAAVLGFCAASYMVIYASGLSHRNSDSMKEFGRIINGMRLRMRFYRSTLPNAAEEAMAGLKSTGGASAALREMSRRMRLGQNASDAMLALSSRLRGNPAMAYELSCIGKDICQSGSALGAIESSSKRIDLYYKRELANSGYSLQKYSTLTVVLTTVLPSFAIFTSVGLSIIGNTRLIAGAVAFSMLMALPALYILVKSLMWKYEG